MEKGFSNGRRPPALTSDTAILLSFKAIITSYSLLLQTPLYTTRAPRAAIPPRAIYFTPALLHSRQFVHFLPPWDESDWSCSAMPSLHKFNPLTPTYPRMFSHYGNFLTRMLVVANLANTKSCKEIRKMTKTLTHGYSSESTQ